MTIKEFDRITIFAQASNASPYGKLNCITELQTCLQSVAGFFSGVKGLGGKVEYSPPCSAEVKNEQIYTSTPPVWLHVVDMHSTTSKQYDVPDISTV
jgi:hypothetical protein